MKYFTTLTQASQVDESPLIKFLESISPRWIYTHEYGKNGDNHHIHIYLHTEKYQSTDTFTRAIKKKLYTKDFLKSLSTQRKLVVTKLASKQEGCIEYLLKEQKSTENIKFSGFDENYIKLKFKKLDIKNLDKDYVKLTLTKAPLKLHEIMPIDCPIEIVGVIKYLSILMNKHKLITHHLCDENTLNKIIFGLKFLRGIEIKSYI